MRLTGARVPALDGVRGVAVALVLAEHGGFLPGPAGSFGVTVFFVLSGYLISRLIVEAHDDRTWSMRGFLWRRAVRLVPALLVVATVMLAVWVASGRDPVAGVGYYAAAVLYVQNWTVEWLPHSFMGHSWSLAVEEQFYLLWPLVLPWVAQSRRRIVGLMILAGMLALVRTQEVLTLTLGAWANTSTPMNAYALMFGAVIALKVKRVAPPTTALSACMVLGCLVYVASSDVSAPTTWAPLAALVAVVLVWAGMSGDPALGWRPLVDLGRISYAAYLWHWPLLFFTGTLNAGTWVSAGVLAVSLCLATASTLWFEEPLRRRWSAVAADDAVRFGAGVDAGRGGDSAAVVARP